jgi:hypothetical protein
MFKLDLLILYFLKKMDNLLLSGFAKFPAHIFWVLSHPQALAEVEEEEQEDGRQVEAQPVWKSR